MMSTIERQLVDGAHQTVARSYLLDLGSDSQCQIQAKELLFENGFLSKVMDDKKS